MTNRITKEVILSGCLAFMVGTTITGCFASTDVSEDELSMEEISSQELALSNSGADSKTEMDNAHKHCVLRLHEGTDQEDEALLEENKNKDKKQEIECYKTFAESMAMATNGRVVLPSDTTPQTLTAEQNDSISNLGSAPMANDVVWAVHFRYENFSGSSLTIVGSCRCDQGCHGSIQSLTGGLSWWNDRVSSLRAYAGCWVISYEHYNYGGREHLCKNSTACSNMWVADPYYDLYMDNRTSSMKYF